MAAAHVSMASCFSGKASFLTCCLDHSVDECPVGGIDSPCCMRAAGPSRWFIETLRCWHSFGGQGTAYGAGPLRKWCCGSGSHNDRCFGGDFSADRCCVKPPAIAVATALRKETWRSIGEQYHAECQGESQHFSGVRCVPDWLSMDYSGLFSHLLYCGPKVSSLAFHLLMMVSMNYALYMHDPGPDVSGHSSMLLSKCFRFYDRTLRASRFHALRAATVVLLSPMIHDFDVLMEGLALQQLIGLAAKDPRAQVLGLPTSDNGTWSWPVLRLRRAYWKLSAIRYPFAYGSWAQPHHSLDLSHCYVGDTTSGTRVYNSSVLRTLLTSPQQRADLGSAWMLGLDLGLKHLKNMRGRALTCLTGAGTILEEESYLLHTVLEESLARSYDIEAARFHPAGKVQTKCIAGGTLAEALSANAAGMVVPYCIRLALKHGMQKLKRVVEVFAGPDAVLMPIYGTSLSIMRLGSTEGEVIPWDYDADMVLVLNRMNVRKLRGHLEAAGFTVEYGDVGTHFGTSGREVHLKTEYRDPDLNITADIDLWLETDGAAGATSVLPHSRLRLHTLPMVVNSDMLFWMRFRGTTAPRDHLYPNEMHGYLPVKGFACPGHSACIPPGWLSDDGFREGGMPDAFAQLDSWD
eukprot:s3870_g2.t1